MSEYTDSASRPGRKGAAGTDTRELMLTEFGQYVIVAYDEAIADYDNLRYIRNITQGKSDTFPIIGRKRDASEHEAGEIVLGGTIEHNEVEITVDKILVDSVFIPDVDQLLLHYNLSEPYANQIGQSIGSTNAKRIAIMHILASRTTGVAQGQPTPAYYYHADLKTNAGKMEEAAFLSAEYLKVNDISGDKPRIMLPWREILLLSRYSGIEGGPVTTGSGNRSQGTIGPMAGLQPSGTNLIPKTNITTGNTKYRGDFSTTVGHCSSRMAVGTLERSAMKLVMKEQEDRLGTLILGSMLNGHGVLRPECSIEWRTDAISGRDDLATISAA